VIVMTTAGITMENRVILFMDVFDAVRMTYETRGLLHFRVKWQDEPLKLWEVVE
jgi:hypothetical protein